MFWGHYHKGNTDHIKAAVDAALNAKEGWGESALAGAGCDILEGRRFDQRTLSL